jgi:transcriptional regulator with XRE-family HTH domain
LGILVNKKIDLKMNKKQRLEVGHRIKIIRVSLKDGSVTQHDMAKILGVKQGTVSKLEKGIIEPTPDHLLKLSKISDKSIDWILKGDE